MFTPAAALSLDPLQKHTLESLARAGSTPQRLARKCEVILLAAEGIPNNAIAQKTGLSRPTVIATRADFYVAAWRRWGSGKGANARAAC